VKVLAAMLALVVALVVTGAHAAPDQSDAYSRQLGRLINDYRARHGVRPLAFDAPLAELAHDHATRMAREDRLSHDDFKERFSKARSPTCVENVGSGHGTAKAEFEAWRNSPAHDHNLLDSRITRMGIAIEGRYVTFFACR
jgi:uncharacterized protein YkwD